MSKSIISPLLMFTPVVFMAVSVAASCPMGDLTADCRVSSDDLRVLAEHWLDPPGSPADLNGDDQIGVGDFAVLATDWGEAGIPLVINEVMASNSSQIQDPQGEYDDWVEIHNFGAEAIDLAGMYVTDDLDEPTKWRIPGGSPSATTVAAGGYLLIWADNDVGDSGLHANFRLSAGGDEIGLFATDGRTLIDSISFGDQSPDISFGRYPDGSDNLRLMGFPSPGAQNIGIYMGFVADTKFSRDRGFYDAPFTVALTTETEGATIYYSLDGKAPYETGGRAPTGMIYTGPITISTTTCLRAAALKPGWMPTNVDTHTYIFLDDVIGLAQQDVLAAGYPSTWHGGHPADYEMDPEIYNDPAYADQMENALLSVPTLSLATDKDNLFSHDNNADRGGIYIYTGHSSTGGRGWERPVSAEFFTQHGAGEFQINCGLRIQGGESRRPNKCPKHSFSLRFRGEYGPTSLDYDLFEGSPVNSFDTIQLRGFFNNVWTHWSPAQRERGQYIRDQWMRDSLIDMGQKDACQGLYAHLYLNGIYWGLYNLHERPVASHYAAYNGGDEEDIDAINGDPRRGGRVSNGTIEDWTQLKNLVAGRNWEQICERLDVDNFIDWVLANRFAANNDLKYDTNWRAAGGGPHDRPWRFYSWDAEHVLENVNEATNSLPDSDPTGLLAYLDDIEEFRVRFGDHVHRHLFNSGALMPERNLQRWIKRADEIDLAVIAESARWGDYRRDMHSYSSGPYYLYTKNDFWIPEKEHLLGDYFPARTDIALRQFRNLGLYPSIDAPVFRINGSYQHGGYVMVSDSFSMTASGGTIWYTLDGSDPRKPGSPQPPAVDTTLVAESAAKRVLVPTGPVSGAWRTDVLFNDRDWISGTGGVGYERGSGYEVYIGLDIEGKMYGDYTSCYIRIPFAVSGDPGEFDILTLRMRYDDAFVAYVNGVEVERALFDGAPAWNSEADSIHSDSQAANFESFDISGHIGALHEGGNILAIHGLNASTSSSDFLISAELVAGRSGSPPDGDGGMPPGAIQYTGPISFTESTHVKARVRSGNTWSALNEATYAVGPVAENLRITEIMYHPLDTNNPDDPNAEFIELKNVGAETMNIHLVKFTNGVDFTFPSIELVPAEYVLVVKDTEAFAAKYGLGYKIAGQYAGSLNNNGERVELHDAAGTTIHNFRYRDGWYNITDGDGFSLTVKGPANADPNRWGDKATWRPSAKVDGSPGFDDTGQIPELGDIVINEVLAHSHAEAFDWIELHNTTDRTINIGGWFLSDDGDNLKKYEIAEGRTITAGGYVVFTEDLHFGNWDDPGAHVPFALSENGETLCLHSGRDGELTGYSEQERFGASETGVAFGRYQKSTGSYNFVAMSVNTPASTNAYPKVGPVVITEIMYHPDSPADAEYVELLNISDSEVPLYNFVTDEPWRFTDDPDNPGIEFLFPSDPPATLASGEYILMVKDLATFSSKYSVPGGTQIFAWGAGRLDNGGEKVQISMPGDVDAEGIRQYIRVDRVRYSDGSHPDDFASGVDPWPTGADGLGSSLSRLFGHHYGNDPNNWQASAPSPGAAN